MRRLTPSQLMAFADHVYAASERVEDTMTAEDRKEQLGYEEQFSTTEAEARWRDRQDALGAGRTDGEECVYCGKDSWTCEHFKPEEQDSDTPYSSRDEGRNPDGSGMSYGERNSG